MVAGPAAVKPKTPWLLPSMRPCVRGSCGFRGGFFWGRVVYMIHTDTDIFVLAFQVEPQLEGTFISSAEPIQSLQPCAEVMVVISSTRHPPTVVALPRRVAW